jgi:excinuclease ABC subunit C
VVTQDTFPELKLVRSQKQKGTYFGPFLEKTSARKVYDFLIKTFKLKLCKKKIANGCLYYHMGICSGKCRPDFDKNDYLERLELAKLALKNNHNDFLNYLKNLIKEHNKQMEFEKSRDLQKYVQAFQRVFDSLNTKPLINLKLDEKDIWFLTENKSHLFLFKEKHGVLIKKEFFYFPVNENQINYLDYFESYYRAHPAPSIILVNFEIEKETKKLYQNFIKSWHNKDYDATIIKPVDGHFADLIKLAKIHVETELAKQLSAPKALKNLLKLKIEPRTIDCFDISHKQGMSMVGSCVRFTDGQPDKKNFRHFKIKTLSQQNDYAALKEIVSRRYRNGQDLPDLILIDGGKGQLNAVQFLFPQTEFASLAKQEETIFSNRIPNGRKLSLKTGVGQLLIALRDYTHHFAISFHRKTEQTKSLVS